MYSSYIKIRAVSYLTNYTKYALQKGRHAHKIGKISRNITSFPVCLLKNLELDHLYYFTMKTQQAATEPLLHRYEMRSSESHWTSNFLSGTAHTHLAQGVLPLRHTGEIQSVRWLQLHTPQHGVTRDAVLSLVCSIKQGKALLKTSKIMIEAEVLHSPTCKKEETQTSSWRCCFTYCVLCSVSKTRGRNKQKTLTKQC